MVSMQDISLQLTKPAKELAQWDFPLSQTLEKYCSLFNNNKNFGEAGLILQNSTSVYTYRLESLWSNTEYCRNVLLSYDQEETTKSTKKKDRRTNACSYDFKTVDFVEEVDKNINIKKNHEAVKYKNRRFTQLEKGIAQHVSIDIYDVNEEIIGKKYDFRCNQNINMDGILVDEFAPQDFYCGDNTSNEKSLYKLCDTSQDSSIQDNSNANVDTSADSQGEYDSEEEISDLITSLESDQQSPSFSRDEAETDNTLAKTQTNISNISYHNTGCINLDDCPDTPNTSSNGNLSIIINSDNNASINNDINQYLDNNINQNIDASSLLYSPPESVNSKGRRISLMDDSMLNDMNGDVTKIQSANSIKNNSLNKRDKMQRCLKTMKLLKRKAAASCKKQNKVRRNILEDPYFKEDRSNMFKTSRACIKYILKYDPLRYKGVTNAELDFLGFQLRDNTESDVDDDTMRNINNNVMSTNDNVISPSDEGISEIHSPSPVSPLRENFCDLWFRSDSPQVLSQNVDKWHEMIQPKLHDSEYRSTFCIRDYGSRIMKTLKTGDQQKVTFDSIVQNESHYEVARYFLASLDLAAKQRIDIKANGDSKHNIEIILHKSEKQRSINIETNLHN